MSEPEQELTKGCVVMMKASSGMRGYGNGQCVSEVCEPLGTISLYGHNQHYKIYDIAKVLEYPALNAQGRIESLETANAELVEFLDRICKEDCGCNPCRDQCTSDAAKAINYDGIIDEARPLLAKHTKEP